MVIFFFYFETGFPAKRNTLDEKYIQSVKRLYIYT